MFSSSSSSSSSASHPSFSTDEASRSSALGHPVSPLTMGAGVLHTKAVGSAEFMSQQSTQAYCTSNTKAFPRFLDALNLQSQQMLHVCQTLQKAWHRLRTPIHLGEVGGYVLAQSQALVGSKVLQHPQLLTLYLTMSQALLTHARVYPKAYAHYAEQLFLTYHILREFDKKPSLLGRSAASLLKLKDNLATLLLGTLETTLDNSMGHSFAQAEIATTQEMPPLEVDAPHDTTPVAIARERFVQQLKRCIQLALDTELHPHLHKQLMRQHQEVITAIESQQVFQALHTLKSLPLEDQYHPVIQTLVCACLWSLEDYKGMDAILKHLIEHGSVILQHDMLLCLQRLQQVQLASPLNELEELIELVDTCLQTRQFAAGANYYKRLMQYLPNKEDGLSYLGHLHCQAGQFEQATHTYREAIAHRPEDAVAYNNLGVLYLEYHQDPLEAHELLQQATKLKPNYTMAWFNLGRCYRKLSQAQQAATCLMKAKELNQTLPEVGNHLIEAQLRGLFSLDD